MSAFSVGITRGSAAARDSVAVSLGRSSRPLPVEHRPPTGKVYHALSATVLYQRLDPVVDAKSTTR